MFEVKQCLARWQSKDLFLPCFQRSIDSKKFSKFRHLIGIILEILGTNLL
jgi:hypothetical protein